MIAATLYLNALVVFHTFGPGSAFMSVFRGPGVSIIALFKKWTVSKCLALGFEFLAFVQPFWLQ